MAFTREQWTEVWDKQFAKVDSPDNYVYTAEFEFLKAESWFTRISIVPPPEGMGGKKLFESTHIRFVGNTPPAGEKRSHVGNLFFFSDEDVKPLLPEIQELMGSDLKFGLNGLYVPPETTVPIHLDSLPVRTHVMFSMMLSGTDSETAFYNTEGDKIIWVKGIHDFYFTPTILIHGATTRKDDYKLLQIVYPENVKKS